MEAQPRAVAEVDTLVVGGGQAGLATSYWLRQAGVEHCVVERRETLGGAWQDRWDGFVMNTPNFSLALPGWPYSGDQPEGFMPRDEAVDYFRSYAAAIAAPVITGTAVTRVSPAEVGFFVETSAGNWQARNVVLASGGYSKPRIPALAGVLPDTVTHLHSDVYRSPSQLPDGAVLIVGTGQSGGQIAEELLAAGRDVHLAVSHCPEAPRRYRGRDLIYWLIQLGKNGRQFGLDALTVDKLPSPAARFACNPLLSGTDGGHSIHLRDLGRQGVQLHGHLEGAADGELIFTDDLSSRLAAVESEFSKRRQVVIDAYIAAAGIDAPPFEPRLPEDWQPDSPARVNLAAANIRTVLWATGYGLDFGYLDLPVTDTARHPVLDQWNYPRHSRGVTERPGLYAVGLPWLNGHWSSIVGGVGRDAAYLAEHIAAR